MKQLIEHSTQAEMSTNRRFCSGEFLTGQSIQDENTTNRKVSSQVSSQLGWTGFCGGVDKQIKLWQR